MEMGRPYDAEIEYLQSTASSGFNVVTDKAFSPQSTFELKYKIDNILTQTTYQAYFTRETTVARTPTVYMGGRSNGYYYCSRDTSGGQKYILREVSRNTNVHTLIVDFENKTVSLDGVQSAFATSFTQYTVSSRICLFKGIDSTYQGLYGKIYYFKIKKNNQLLLDLIPVRKGNVGFFYDKISGSVLKNTDSGTFVLGPDKN